MRERIFEILVLAMVVFVSALPARAESGSIDLAADGCITGKCHAGLTTHRFVHGPVAVGDCLHCHNKTGDHKFVKAAGDGVMCFMCHEETPAGKSIVCVKCHDPHGTDVEFQLKGGAGKKCAK